VDVRGAVGDAAVDARIEEGEEAEGELGAVSRELRTEGGRGANEGPGGVDAGCAHGERGGDVRDGDAEEARHGGSRCAWL
jgi:hypothetical protein